VWKAARTPEGPVAFCAANVIGDPSGAVEVRAFGAGADWVLDRADALLGLDDDFDLDRSGYDPVVRALAHRAPGLRVVRTGLVVDTLLPTIIEQKVTSAEAFDSWAHLVHAWGEPAPGPPGLRLAPTADRLASTPYFAYHRFGIERRRADFLRGVASRATSLDALVDAPMTLADVRLRLLAVPGLGPWTVGHALLVAFGDPDAVIVGDYHLPDLVCLTLAGERRGCDDRMLELLEPYRGQRGRIQRLIAMGTARPAGHYLRRPRRNFTRF